MRRQFMATVVARGIGSCLQAILLVFFARAVDQSVFGLTNALLGLGAIAAVLADLGITTYIVRMWAFDRDRARVVRALRISNASALALGLVLTALFAWASHAFDGPAAVGLVAVWIALEKCTETYLSVHSAEQSTLVPGVSILLRRIIPLALFAALIQANGDAVIALIASLVVGGLAGQVHAHFSLPKFLRVRKTLVPARVVLSESRSFGIATLASQIRNADTFLVSLCAGLAASGAFAAATKLTIPIYLVASAVALSVIPGVAKAGRSAVLRIAVILVSGMFVGAAALVAVRPWLDPVMSWIYGPTYTGAGWLLYLILSATLVAALGFPLAALLQAVGLTRAVAIIETVGALLVVAGLVIGASLGGSSGAAVGALIAQLLRVALLIIKLLIWRSTSVSSPEACREGVAR